MINQDEIWVLNDIKGCHSDVLDAPPLTSMINRNNWWISEKSLHCSRSHRWPAGPCLLYKWNILMVVQHRRPFWPRLRWNMWCQMKHVRPAGSRRKTRKGKWRTKAKAKAEARSAWGSVEVGPVGAGKNRRWETIWDFEWNPSDGLTDPRRSVKA